MLNPVRLVKGESKITLTGTARLENDVPVDFSVSAQPLQFGDYVRLAGDHYPVEDLRRAISNLMGLLRALTVVEAFKSLQEKRGDCRLIH